MDVYFGGAEISSVYTVQYMTHALAYHIMSVTWTELACWAYPEDPQSD